MFLKHLFSLSQSLEPMLFKEAMQYILPKSLLEPIYHCFYYFDIINVSFSEATPVFTKYTVLNGAPVFTKYTVLNVPLYSLSTCTLY